MSNCVHQVTTSAQLNTSAFKQCQQTGSAKITT